MASDSIANAELQLTSRKQVNNTQSETYLNYNLVKFVTKQNINKN